MSVSRPRTQKLGSRCRVSRHLNGVRIRWQLHGPIVIQQITAPGRHVRNVVRGHVIMNNPRPVKARQGDRSISRLKGKEPVFQVGGVVIFIQSRCGHQVRVCWKSIGQAIGSCHIEPHIWKSTPVLNHRRTVGQSD